MIIDEMQHMEDLLSGNGVTVEEISNAEMQLGIVFADDYKQYLIGYGIAVVNGHELTGLGAL